ncbi:Glycolipid anchored surface protein 4 precursor [Elasticomyces elasticus]|uniref:1,3-beta-glucanosyltransferase n=1 Tax=Exophiala sideris TaxID=1016849 RepID=A0ABR0JGJ5_9EURO|nr:Glycolipid anchored surface protein 4 precursor [Elasticomyces elasticus]KAK5033175.1 Glycolipid anchored surface protein 4 precursor [Exophiala sideris]KAK5063719.1 Glycolipid anchored surface protein 4 precursor [Exophiala sideris]
MTRFTATLLALVALFTSYTLAVSPLVVKGSDFVNTVDGTRFQIIGVAYQPGGSSGFNPGSGLDPLSDASICLRDAVLMQKLGVNAIRVYNLDPDLDHTQCASIFNAAGIYMILDVNSPLPDQSLDRTQPWNSYSMDYLQRVFKVVEDFMQFNNTLGFFSGNEVINEDSVPEVPSYIRAVTRDIKDYISAQSKRSIPVGYSAADVRPLLMGTFNYLSCGLSNDTSSKIDFFGLNSYSWCGDATFQSSGYDVLVSDFSNTTIPIFFSEYGCNLVTPRNFSEVPVLYSSQMTPVFSGGLIYEYSEEVNNYGLVNLNDNGTVSILADYNNLQARYDALDVTTLEQANVTATSLTAPTCNVNLLAGSNFTDSFDLPARPSGVDALISSGVSGNTTGATSVSSTQPTQTVYDTNGNALSGLKLNVLAWDQSNLPGNNTSGTTTQSPSGSTTSTTSSSTATKTNAAARVDDIKLGTLVMGALSVGLYMQL